MTDVQRIEIAKIITTGHLREPRPARVKAIAASIEAGGQERPIEVSPTSKGRYYLAHGRVRIAALKLLGRTEVQAVVRPTTFDQRRRREIDENLLQEGCTVLERARYLAVRKGLYEAQHPETTHGGARRGDRDQVAKLGDLKFSAWAAGAFGLGERTAERLTKIGADLHENAALLLAESEWADVQAVLEQISRLEAFLQVEVAGLLTQDPDPVQSVAEAIAMATGRPADNQPAKGWSSFLGGWGRMGARERRDALRQIASDLPTGVRIVFEEETVGA